jgi:3-oxosteroid 1-dehydrogenase
MDWDHSVDVLVVGSGNGGLTAALTSHELGAGEVLVIEKAARYGGSSARSGGGLWIPCNHYARAAGADDSLEDAATYLRHTLPADAEPGRIAAYLRAGPEMIRFLHERIGARYVSVGTYPDYFTSAPGARLGHRLLEPEPFWIDELGAEADRLEPTHPQISMFGLVSVTQREAHDLAGQVRGSNRLAATLLWRYLSDFPWRLRGRRDRRVACGAAGVARLRLAMLQRGLPLWLNTALIELLMEQDRVVGVLVERDGRRIRIRARRGVVLAAGGFDRNQVMREQYLPKPTDARWSAGVDGNQGDAIRAGAAAGAALGRMDGAWWCTTFCVPGEDLARLAIMEKCSPGCCVVNQLGRRVGNESQNYMSYVVEALARHSAESPSSPLWMVFDARFRSKYLVGPLFNARLRPDWLLPRRFFAEDFLARASSVAELARATGIDPAGLERTVAAMNDYARQGRDPEFGRGDSAYDHYYGDPEVHPNPCLAPIDQPPFYAIRTWLGDFGTHGGLVTDEHARVCRDSGAPIAGLYAVGNCSAALLSTYPGPGSTLGPAMTFAYLAAQHLCGTTEAQ